MGMRMKLRHTTAAEIQSAKRDPAKFYRELFGITGAPADRTAMMMDLAKQMSEAIHASPYGQEFREMPETKRVAEATIAGKTPDQADQQVMWAKMMELLPKTGFKPDLSAATKYAPKQTKTPNGLELEKSWHVIHYILSGKVWETGDAPVEHAILGGTEIPDKESVMGYGPARYLDPEETKVVSEALDKYPIEAQAAAYDAKAAEEAEVYVPDHEAEEILHYFTLLKDYYHEAVAKDEGMMMWIE